MNTQEAYSLLKLKVPGFFEDGVAKSEHHIIDNELMFNIVLDTWTRTGCEGCGRA